MLDITTSGVGREMGRERFTRQRICTTFLDMKVLTYETLARDFPKAWASLETRGEEVVVTHHRRRVARIVPEPSPANALEVFEDLHGVLGEREGAVLANTLGAVRKAKGRRETIEELRNPWVS